MVTTSAKLLLILRDFVPECHLAKFGGNWITNKGKTEGGTLCPSAYILPKYPNLNRVKHIVLIFHIHFVQQTARQASLNFAVDRTTGKRRVLLCHTTGKSAFCRGPHHRQKLGGCYFAARQANVITFRVELRFKWRLQ